MMSFVAQLHRKMQGNRTPFYLMFDRDRKLLVRAFFYRRASLQNTHSLYVPETPTPASASALFPGISTQDRGVRSTLARHRALCVPVEGAECGFQHQPSWHNAA